MKTEELKKLKKLLNEEIIKRNRVNELLNDKLIQEFMQLNKQNIIKLETDKWLVLQEILKEFRITESNRILVCTGYYRILDHSKEWWGGDYNSEKMPFKYAKSPLSEYQKFEDIETNKVYIAFKDDYIQQCIDTRERIHAGLKYDYQTPSEYCHEEYGKYLVSEFLSRYTVLNPYNSEKNKNGFNDVQKDFFLTAIEQGQPTAKKLVLSKYPKMK